MIVAARIPFRDSVFGAEGIPFRYALNGLQACFEGTRRRLSHCWSGILAGRVDGATRRGLILATDRRRHGNGIQKRNPERALSPCFHGLFRLNRSRLILTNFPA